MGFLRYIIGLAIAVLIAALSAVAMPMAPSSPHHAELFLHQHRITAEHTDVHFTARAPPLTAANVAFTGAAVAEYGNGFVMHEHEFHVASLRLGADFDAPNRIPTSDRRIEIAELFDNSKPRNGIQVGDRTVLHDGSSGGARVFTGVSDAEIRSYFSELTGQPFPVNPTTVVPGRGNIYSVQTPDGNFNLRDFSSSGTGRWNIDIPNTLTGLRGGRGTTELKFE